MRSFLLAVVIFWTQRIASQGPLDCGQSCLTECRKIAVRCVQLGVNSSDFVELMKCVIFNVNDKRYAIFYPDHLQEVCKPCVDAELEKMTVEDKAECLKGGKVNSCTGMENAKDCEAIYEEQGCAWVANKCYKVAEDELDVDQYKTVMSNADNNKCELLGGVVREGNCKARQRKKVKCGAINKKKNADCKECEHLCTWLPTCRYKKKKARCGGGPRPFSRK